MLYFYFKAYRYDFQTVKNAVSLNSMFRYLENKCDKEILRSDSNCLLKGIVPEYRLSGFKILSVLLQKE